MSNGIYKHYRSRASYTLVLVDVCNNWSPAVMLWPDQCWFIVNSRKHKHHNCKSALDDASRKMPLLEGGLNVWMWIRLEHNWIIYFSVGYHMHYQCRNQIFAQPHFHDIAAYDERHHNYEIMTYIAYMIFISRLLQTSYASTKDTWTKTNLKN